MEELEKLKNDFDEWRNNKAHRGVHIPKKLWARAVELAKTVDPIEVGHACQIPAAKIRKKLNDKQRPNVQFAKGVALAPKKEVIELTTASGITIKVYS